MGDIAAFVGNISNQRLARKSRYMVKVTGPQGDAQPSINMMCESISFPGQNVRSVPDTLRFGPAREHAQGMTYGPFTATFICSSDLREKSYFEDWQSQVINLDSWEVRYYDSYKGSLIITQLDINNNPTYAIKVEEAYPKTIMPQDVGYAQSNAYQTVQVEFTYRFWKPEYLPETMEADWDPNTGTTRKKKGKTVVKTTYKNRYNYKYINNKMVSDEEYFAHKQAMKNYHPGSLGSLPSWYKN